jgi:hypothetical protein
MMNLFEMMMQAQGGNAVNNLSQQFGLSPKQTTNALEALIPALSMGMQRQAETPQGLEGLIGLFGAGQHANAYGADGDGIPDHLQTQGNDILGQLFGSKDMSRAVAAQASAMSGVSDTILKQMLPIVATMMMGGLFKGAQSSGLGGLLQQAMQGGLANMMAGGAGNPMGQIMGGGQTGANPMGNLFGSILGSIFGQKAAPQPVPQAPDPMMAGLDMLKTMMGAGQQVQQSYQNNLQQVFDQFMPRR